MESKEKKVSMKNRRDNISVCLATYNGEKYIREQLESILPQLIENDEIIVVDDKSTDGTERIIRTIDDKRIVFLVNDKRLGVNKNFEKAINLSKNEFIFLCDQDDIWTDNRVDVMINELKKENVELVSGNMQAIDNLGKRINFSFNDLKPLDSLNSKKNISKIFLGKAGYYGCAMAFRRSLLPIIVPIPDYVESHDLWIALIANYKKSNCHISETVLLRRVHGSNASIIKRRLKEKIYARVIFVKSIVEIHDRIKRM